LVILCKYKNKIKKIKYHIVEHTTQHRELKLEARTKTGDEERKKISHVEHIIQYRELKLEERKEKKVIETQEKSIPLTNKCQIIFSSSIYDGCVFK
jgi:predicted nucleic acid-binding OB-fold protein